MKMSGFELASAENDNWLIENGFRITEEYENANDNDRYHTLKRWEGNGLIVYKAYHKKDYHPHIVCFDNASEAEIWMHLEQILTDNQWVKKYENGGIKTAYNNIRRLLRDGYPWKIKGNDGYEAVLVDEQPLLDGEYCAIYRYPRGTCCYSLMDVKRFTVVRRFPNDFKLTE